MNNRPTPETDAIVRNAATADHPPTRLAATLTVKCEKLERERNEANEELHKQLVRFDELFAEAEKIRIERDEARTELEMWRDGNILHEIHRDELEKVERERDEAMEALRKAIRFVEAYEPHTRGVEADQNETLTIIRKALEEAK